jgi:thymidylate synthase ThyX
MIEAKIIEDSISPDGIRLTTMQLMFPRFILPEFNTHRVFSRNASSSRAIPVAKMIEQVRTNPAMPVHWGKNQPGMQANEQLTGPDLAGAQDLWDLAAQQAANIAETMNRIGLHKQVANRILEPFQHIHVVVTATDWDNFFALRCHPDAQPEIRELADRMAEAIGVSQPMIRGYGQWHLPYVSQDERDDISDPLGSTATLLRISAARCARVSYLTHDGKTPDIEKDLELFQRLVGSEPIHASPTEHQATPLGGISLRGNLCGNFDRWIQHRKIIEHEFKQ